MRYAIFSDIHGNREAWERVLEDIKMMEAEVLVCLGDVVGYGPLPQEVLDDIRRHTDYFVLGNHDAAAAGMLNVSYFNDSAREVLEWTKQQLTPESIEFLRNVPLKISSENILFVHAEIEQPHRFGYIEEVGDAQKNFAQNDHFVTFVGHTHYPLIFELTNDGSVLEHEDNDYRLSRRSRYIVNVGSVGEPRNPDDLRGRYVIYDSETREVIFRRVEFDPEVYREHLASTSLTVMPFFLRVIDNLVQQNEEEERYAMMVDMNIPIASLDYLKHFSKQKEETISMRPKVVPPSGPRKRVKKRKKNSGISPALFVFFLFATLIAASAVWFFNFAPQQVRDYVYDFLPGQDEAEDAEAEEPAEKALLAKNGSPDPEAGGESKAVAGGLVSAVSQPQPEPRTRGETPDPVEVASASTDPPIPAAPAPDPEPTGAAAPGPAAAETPEAPPKSILWQMPPPGADELPDSTGEHPLRKMGQFRPIGPIAPDPIPQTGTPNRGAMTLGFWTEAAPSGEFDLRADRSFTFEGWIMADRSSKPIFLAGTRPRANHGWRFDLVAAAFANEKGSIRFLYDNGEGKIVTAMSKIEFFEPVPHFFTLIWDNEGAGPEKGTIRILFDDVEVANESIPHSEIREPEIPAKFQLGAHANPSRVAVDELRFTQSALWPKELLNAEKAKP